MLHDGVYELSYTGGCNSGGALAEYNGEALAVLRNGKILGADRWGGVFSGTYEFDPIAQNDKVRIRIDVPPEGELITGFAAGPGGATLEIVAAVEQRVHSACTRVDIGGEPVDVEFSFIGPLPL